MNHQKKKAILIVDDEPLILDLLEKYLLACNYQVMTAENGSQAVSHIQSNVPDVVITDLFMPEMDGFELLRYTQKAIPELPVVVITGLGGKKEIAQALLLGAWDFMRKPFKEFSFLRFKIEKVLEKSRLIQEKSNCCHHLETLVKQKDTELLANKNHCQTIINSIYNWEYWHGPDGNIVYISPSCKRITGYSSHEFTHDPKMLYEIVHPEDRDIFCRHVDDSRYQKEVNHLEFRIIRRDGRQHWIAHFCRPVVDCENNWLGRCCSNRDITYRKKVETDFKNQETALIEKSHCLEQTSAALKTLLDQREIEKRAIEQSMVANLKRFVFPYLDDLERQPIGENAKAYLGIIRTNIQHLISPASKYLSSAYLELSQMETRVADLIRQGNATKSIADMLNISTSTVEKHRNKIRQKLNISKKKVNLYAYLNSLR